MIECAWCGVRYERFQARCDGCGGPLPPPPGEGAGEPPPPPPRALPAPFERRVRYTHNVEYLIGVIFCGVGGAVGGGLSVAGMGSPVPQLAFVGVIVLLVFGGIGAALATHGRKRALATLLAFREGVAALGSISEVYVDTSVKINGRSPWAIVYTFKVGGVEHQGRARTFDARAREREPGQQVHVLYVPTDPSKNTLYPPVK